MTSRSGWIDLTRCPACGSDRWSAAGTAAGADVRRCDACGHLRYDAVAAPEEIYRDGYHDGTADYGWDSADEHESAYETAVSHARLAWLERRVTGRSLADVGGGLGWFAKAATDRGWDATLVEPVPAAVAFAKESLGVHAVLGGLDSVAGGDARFDLITLNHVVEHLPDALDQVRAMAPALAPGGMLYIEVPSQDSLSRRLNRDRWFGWQHGQHVSHFTRRSLRGFVERAGYTVVEASTFVPGWHGLLPDAYAHFLGLEPALQKVVGVRRTNTGARATGAGGAPAAEGEIPPLHADRPAVPIDQLTGARRLMFGRGFDLVARAEERAGLGTNLRVLVRPAS